MMSIIRILLITFVLLLALFMGLKVAKASSFMQLNQALQIQLEDRAGKPVFQR